VACAPEDDSSASGGDDTATTAESLTPGEDACAPTELPLKNEGVLTVGTDSPAYEPWFVDNDPSNGKGYESAVTYAVAEQLGFSADQVEWIKVPFNTSYVPGEKKFDFDNVKLKFTEDALKAVARQAVERKVGARGLMMILEELLLDAMYTLPSQKRVKEFVITSEMVERRRAVPGEGLTGIDGAAA
jgi:hypothetical protein